MMNKQNVLSNEWDQAPKVSEGYQERLNQMSGEIEDAFHAIRKGNYQLHYGKNGTHHNPSDSFVIYETGKRNQSLVVSHELPGLKKYNTGRVHFNRKESEKSNHYYVFNFVEPNPRTGEGKVRWLYVDPITQDQFVHIGDNYQKGGVVMHDLDRNEIFVEKLTNNGDLLFGALNKEDGVFTPIDDSMPNYTESWLDKYKTLM